MKISKKKWIIFFCRKSLGRNLGYKFSYKCLDHAKQSVTDALKTTSKRAIQKTEKTTGDFFYNEIADKLTKFSKKSLCSKRNINT